MFNAFNGELASVLNLQTSFRKGVTVEPLSDPYRENLTESGIGGGKFLGTPSADPNQSSYLLSSSFQRHPSPQAGWHSSCKDSQTIQPNPYNPHRESPTSQRPKIDNTQSPRKVTETMPDWLSHLGNNLESSTSQAIELFSGGPVQVPKQVKSRGDAPVIPNELADIHSSGLGTERVLHEINVLMNTQYDMETPSIKDLITSYIAEEADFGTIFGHVRAWWAEFEPNRFFPSLQSLMLYWKAKDEEQRAEAITGDVTTRPITFPRRVWDLYSNRVVPYWAVMDRAKGLPPGWEKDSRSRHIWPVSHSWMPENERQNVLTPVNDYQWPVPIPDGISLDNVRIELLNIGAEYVWLDVLCLRQFGSQEMEQTRLEEWKLDVPTIGSIYYYASQSISTVTRLNARTIIYYSGLGRAFVVGDLKSPRHWLNRAWTLQETPGIRHTNRNLPKMDIAAGWTPYSPKRSKRARPPTDDERRASTFFQSLDLVTNRGDII